MSGAWQAKADALGRVSEDAARSVAEARGCSLREVQREICTAGLMPLRYARNARTLSPAQQGMLLDSRVLLVGLGGLGGHVLDTLARMGVGRITGVDGDVFEESNANRQLLCDSRTMGGSKAAAAAERVAVVNAAVDFVPVARFVQGQDFAPLVEGADVVVDALGGLTHRDELHAAAMAAGKPVVSAGIAGCSGWLAVVQPGGPSPLTLLGKGKMQGADQQHGQDTPPSAEEWLGNLAPTVALAAALQCAEILKLLTGQQVLEGLLLFDLQDHTFIRVAL